MLGRTDIFEIDKSGFDVGIDQLQTDPFANIQSLESMCPLAFNANTKPSNPGSFFGGASDIRIALLFDHGYENEMFLILQKFH